MGIQAVRVAFSPDGGRVLSGSKNGSVKLWDAATGRLLRTFQADLDVTSVTFSPDGARVLSGSESGSVKLWDAATGTLLGTFQGHSSYVYSVAFSPDGARILSGSGYMIKLWDVATGAVLRTFQFSSDLFYTQAVAFSPDGTHALSTEENTAKLWEVATGALLRTFQGQQRIGSVALSADGARILSGSGDSTVKLWDAATGGLLRTFQGHEAAVLSVAFSPDGTRGVSASKDKTIKLWNTSTGTLLRTLEGHSDEVRSVAFSPEGTGVVSGSVDNTVRLWDVATGTLLRTLESGDWVSSVTFSPDGSRVLSDGIWTHLWDVATGKLIRTYKHPPPPPGFEYPHVLSVAFSPGGSRVLSGTEGHKVHLWDAATGRLLRTFQADGMVSSVAFSPDGTRVLATDTNTVKLWDAASGRLLRTYAGHAGVVGSVAFLPDAKRLLSGGEDGTVRIWNAASGEILVTMLAASDGEWLAITPEGFFAASPKGHKLISIVRGLEVFSIDQFYQELYGPDLVREKLAGDPDGKVKAAAAKLDLAKLLDSGPVPKVAITSHKATEKSASDQITIEAEVADAGGRIGRIEWRISSRETAGKPITVGVVEGATATAGKITLKQPVALDPGENTIELVAYNGKNLVRSVPARTKVFWSGVDDPTAPPTLHVLAIGVNDYWESKLQLRFAVPDAKAFAEALKEAGKQYYEEVIPKLVTDADATAANLDRVFDDLSTKVRRRDVFVLFAAGHGVTRDGRYYFIPQNFKYQTEKSYTEQAIGQDRIRNWLAKIAAKKSVLIFDTCESGTLAGLQLAALRGGLEQLAAVGRLIEATGRTVLTAAMENQPALEGFKDHGVLTFALLDALARGDRNGDGLISLTELVEHVDGLVPEITLKTWRRRQTPQSLLQGTNFALARQVPSLAPAPGEPIIVPTKATHFTKELLQIFKEAGGKGAIVEELPPFTGVTLVRTEQGWVLIARDGKPLGYVAESKLQKLN
jgi:WD40 repeat protein